MPDFTSPYRSETPRHHVIITQVDTVKNKAVGVERKNNGVVNIDLSLTYGQTITYPRKDEEWFVEKINEVWVLGHKAGYGNEGFQKPADPGDLVTVTTGAYHLETGPVTITAPVTFGSGINVADDTIFDSDVEVGSLTIAQNKVVSSIPYDSGFRFGYDGAIEVTNRAGTAYHGIRSSNFVTVPSWRALKKDFRSTKEYLGDGALNTVRALDIRAWRYDQNVAPDLIDTNEHFGPMLDEVPSPLVSPLLNTEGEDRSSFSVDKLLSVALAAIQEQAQQIDDLTARLDKAGL